jgi:hypothetical protein
MAETEDPIKNHTFYAFVSVDGDGKPEVKQLGAVHNTNVDKLKKLLITADGKTTAETAAPILLDQIIPKESGGGSTRETHNGGRKHKGKKSRGKGRKSRSKSKSRSKARR